MTTLALDIGGANIKAAYGGGPGSRLKPCEIASVAFALWKEPGRLAEKLAEIAARFNGFDRVLVTMTAELCDCFETKRAGVGHVLDAVEEMASGGRKSAKPQAAGAVGVWTTEGRFVTMNEARGEPIKAAASNWHALATFVAGLYPDGLSLLIDTGSTTTDIIRLRDGQPDPSGLTDMQRLNSGELVYLGAGRTPLAALGPAVEWRGETYGVMAEFFATTGDVFLLTGDVAEQPGGMDTADGRPMTRACAAARIVRMIGADLEMVSAEDARELARVFAAVAVERIAAAVARVAWPDKKMEDPYPGPLPKKVEGVGRAVVSGSGDFLAERAALVGAMLPGADAKPQAVEVVRLADRIGARASEAACAYALLQLDSR